MDLLAVAANHSTLHESENMNAFLGDIQESKSGCFFIETFCSTELNLMYVKKYDNNDIKLLCFACTWGFQLNVSCIGLLVSW